MDYKIAKWAARAFSSLNPETRLCPFCYRVLVRDDEGNWYCPNEMCLNETRYGEAIYDRYGKEE